ncbi:hypothetical protein [Niallia oryzisoli]
MNHRVNKRVLGYSALFTKLGILDEAAFQRITHQLTQKGKR